MTAWFHAVASGVGNSGYPGALIELCLESVLVLLVAAGVCLAWRGASASTRHLVWFVALASLPVLLGLAALPHPRLKPLWSISTAFNSGNEVSLTLNLLPAQPGNPLSGAVSGTGGQKVREPRPLSGQRVIGRFRREWMALALSIWAGGAVLGLLLLAAIQFRLSQLARAAKPFDSPDWQVLALEVCQVLRRRRPVALLQADEDLMPVTWGWLRPIVLLPAEAADWPPRRRRLVLLHELAHVKRWDCLTQTVAGIVRALFWINPLVWLAAGRMRIERERACDDLVLSHDCKASDYATELLAIAKAFRPARFVAGITMAHSPQLQGRIAALINPARPRRLRPGVEAAIVVSMCVLVACLAATSGPATAETAESSALCREQMTQLEAFAAAKEKQSEVLAAKAGEAIAPDFQQFFEAALRGDVQTVTNRYEYFKRNHPQYAKGRTNAVERLRTPYWQPVLELCLAYDHVANCEPKYTKMVVDGILNSIPPGSIYFGGTDPGRGLPTAFEKSSIEGDPFFCLTQNALADGTYLDYLRAMYGGRIYTPTAEDSQRCYNDYLNDAMRRLRHDQQFPNGPKQLKPGEDVRMVDGRVNVSGQVAVMSINALLVKVVFDHNPGREFYIEESFPLDWMYPYLEPHGLIMKINRQPQAELPPDVLARDRDYWGGIVAGALGDWLSDQTPVSDVAAFVNRVYVTKDLAGFTGDPLYVQNDYAKRLLSKLRSSIAGVYAWRLSTNSPAEFQPQSEAARERLVQETDLAFRQAFALCPYSPEVVFRYSNFLLQFNRVADARQIAQAAMQVEPKNVQFSHLLQNLEQLNRR